MLQRNRLHCKPCKNKIIIFLLPFPEKEDDIICQYKALTKITAQPFWDRIKIWSTRIFTNRKKMAAFAK